MGLWPVYQILLGIIYIIFRLWLVEIKLKEEMVLKRRYLSRYNCFFFAISVIINFKSAILTFLFLCTYPTLSVAFIFGDLPRSVKIFKNRSNNKNWFWMIVEILTMHIPIIALSIYWATTHYYIIYDISLIADLFIALIIEYVLFFWRDPRNPFGEKVDPPMGYLIIFAITMSFLSFTLILR